MLRALALTTVATLTASVLMIRDPLGGPAGVASAAQPDAALPTDLALVPADAVGSFMCASRACGRMR